MSEWIKTFFCHHHYQWTRNIYGDEINYRNARSEWVCANCGKSKYRLELVRGPNGDAL